MAVEVGRIQAIYRYPVKSMAGESLEGIHMDWHGLDGDRRFAFRRIAETGGFPWLSASKLPLMVLYQPIRQEPAPDNDHPTHVITPEGNVLPLRSDELRDEIMRGFGGEVELMHLKQGIFDEAAVSLFTLATNETIASAAGQAPDIRRYRPNVVIDTGSDEPFTEDQWVGKTVSFGDGADAPAVQVTLRDVRCAMINLSPETAESEPALLKTVARLNQVCAGVYATVIRRGELSVGQTVYVS